MMPGTRTRICHHRLSPVKTLCSPDRRPYWTPSVLSLFENQLSPLNNRFCRGRVDAAGLANSSNRYLLLTPLDQQIEQTIHPLAVCRLPKLGTVNGARSAESVRASPLDSGTTGIDPGHPYPRCSEYFLPSWDMSSPGGGPSPADLRRARATPPGTSGSSSV